VILGYIRVSTEDQAREGVSLDAQAARITSYCQAHNLLLGEIIRDEGVSGTVPPSKRPGLSRALDLIRRGEASGLAVLRLDRLTRSIRDLLALVEDCRTSGWALKSVSDQLDTETPMGMFVLTILGAVSQLERDMISLRTREALQHKRDKGAVLGTAPYGYRKVPGPDGKLTKLDVDADEQRILTRIRQLIDSGVSQSGVADTLNQMGFYARNGKWTRRGIQRALEN